MVDLLPWQDSYWQQLNERRAQGRLPHGLLFSGPAGVGKARFARQFAQALLCDETTPRGTPCGHCRGCRLVEAGSHPDLSIVTLLRSKSDKEKKEIGVDQIREIGHYFSLKSQFGRHKIVIITPADAMSVNAANSLLKTLEEPSQGALLMLVSDRPARLPATIRSRCQELKFGAVERQVALQWLAQTQESEIEPATLLALGNGAPLKALEMADKELVTLRERTLQGLMGLAAQEEDPLSLSEQWVKEDIKSILYWMYSWVTDMVRISATAGGSPLANEDVADELARIAARSSLPVLLEQQQRVVSALQRVEQNLNAQLLLEDLLIEWRRGFSTRKRKAIA